jgi:radical SAM-linked protein
MSIAIRHRFRITYSKTSAMRYTGHLDVLRAWERTIRRAGLAIAFSEGFNPRPRINLAVALPLGITSECELIDILLLEDPLPFDLQNQLNEAAPPGLEVTKVTKIPNDAPKLQKLTEAADYEVRFDQDTQNDNLTEKIVGLLEASDIIRERRGKTYNLRPLILKLETLQENGNTIIQIRLLLKEGATGRPEEVLLALDIDPVNTKIHRSNLILRE